MPRLWLIVVWGDLHGHGLATYWSGQAPQAESETKAFMLITFSHDRVASVLPISDEDRRVNPQWGWGQGGVCVEPVESVA